MIEVPLKHGVLLADEQDAELIGAHHWHSWDNNRGTFYACTNVRLPGGGKTILLAHRLLLPTERGIEVDHRNRNGLDCRRANLRRSTRSQNSANGGPYGHGTTGYRGVSSYRRYGNYTAQITVARQRHHLGYFPDAWSAAEAYNRAALDAWGEFAWQNVKHP